MSNQKIEGPYDPKKTENRIYELWLKSGYFNPDNLPTKSKKKFSIVIPPPNITGSLHMGHVLNTVIQDILIRKKRMEGYRTLWVPGTDHAGIAAQYVVEKQLRKEGLNRFDLGNEKFLTRMWQWMKECGGNIEGGLKKLGLSCDWSRARFTMDNDYQKIVEEAFLHYYKKGWIYQGERVINWCPRCQTSLSDLELEYKEEKTFLWYIKYPIVGENDKFITVATTRPETMLGDTAVAVSPKDERYKKLVGEKAILPLVNKEIPVIADRRVETEFGTGAVKVTPAHSIVDAEIGEEHKLPSPKVIGPFAKMALGPEIKATGATKYDGLPIKEAREQIVKNLEAQGLLEKTEEYTHNVALCYRCASIVENLPSVQWFLKMDQLAKTAISAVKSGKIRFHPKRWEKIYFDWLKNIKDWCISRQIWWGHKIPIDGVDDVLDTWFSSALWPFAVFNKKGDFKKFYPTNTSVTARDIINLWVARMVFSGLEFTKKAPFKDVIINATILTEEGKRMSKSLGTGLDPLGSIEQYGADATRFAIIWQAMGNQDIHWSEETLVAGKKFLNKIWNASRFVLQQIPEVGLRVPKSDFKNLTSADKKILKKLEKIVASTNKSIETYQFGQALHDLYDFFWHDFCDKYLEISKSQISNPKSQTSKVLFCVLTTSLKLLHPFLPHLTEEIWLKIKSDKDNLLMVTPWPAK